MIKKLEKAKPWPVVLLMISLLLVLATVLLWNKKGTSSEACRVPKRLELTTDSLEVQVTSEEINEEMEHELYLYADEEDVNSRGAQEGDIIYLTYIVYANEEVVGDTGESIESFELGDQYFPAELQKHLYGMAPGDVFEFEERLPENCSDWMLAGKNVKFEGQIYKITELVMPKVTNEFVRSNLGCNSVSEYNDYLYNKVYDLKLEQALEEEKERLIREVIDETDFDESLLKEATDSRYDEIIDSYKKYAELFGYSEEDVYNLFDTSIDELYETALYTQKKVTFCNAVIENERLMPSKETYDSMRLEYAKEYGYNSAEEFENDNGAEFLKECVNEIIVKDYLYSLAQED